MASAWGSSWGTSWGNAWGSVGAVTPPVTPPADTPSTAQTGGGGGYFHRPGHTPRDERRKIADEFRAAYRELVEHARKVPDAEAQKEIRAELADAVSEFASANAAPLPGIRSVDWQAIADTALPILARIRAAFVDVQRRIDAERIAEAETLEWLRVEAVRARRFADDDEAMTVLLMGI